MDELVEAFVAEMKTLSRKGGVIEYPDIFAAALSALSSKGLAVVPVEPTEAMQDAGGSSIIRPSIYMGGTPPGAKRRARDVWADMLAAAPKEGPDAILKAALKSESELMPNPRFARPKEGQGA